MPLHPWKSATTGAGDTAAGNQKAVSTRGAVASPSRLGNETCSWAWPEPSIAASAMPMAQRHPPRISGTVARPRIDRRWIGVDACHRERIDIAAITHGVAAMSALGLEAELAVQRDGGGVVGVDGELDPQDAHPAVGVVAHRLHQGRANALPLRFARHRNADRGDVPAPRSAFRWRAKRRG